MTTLLTPRELVARVRKLAMWQAYDTDTRALQQAADIIEAHQKASEPPTATYMYSPSIP